MKLAEDKKSVQYANHLMEELVGSKGLELNLDKSNYIIMGNKTNRKKLKAQTIKSPITLCNQTMKEVKVLRYLGDSICHNLEESVHQTVIKRVAVAKLSVYEIRSVIEDTRSEKLGSLGVAFDIWEAAIVTMLTHNSESWVSMSRKTTKVLDDLFHKFCQIIFRVGTGCPVVSYYWQSGSLTFSNRILGKQLNFIHHLANLPEGALARNILDEQVRLSLPGLYKQCEPYLIEMGIVNLRDFSKWQMKNKVKKFIFRKNCSELLERSQKYKKLDYHKLSNETFERKHYFSNLSLENARMSFRVASKLVPTIRSNYPSKYRRQGIPLTCPTCSDPSSSTTSSTASPPLHSQSHLLTDCVGVSDLRAECDENDDKSLAVFFKKVVARHMEIDD